MPFVIAEGTRHRFQSPLIAGRNIWGLPFLDGSWSAASFTLNHFSACDSTAANCCINVSVHAVGIIVASAT